MSLRMLKVVGALVMGNIAPLIAHGIEAPFPTATSSDYLASLLQRDGIRKPVDLKLRPDLADIARQATEYFDTFDLGCEFTALYEVRVLQNGNQWIAGYEARFECEDGPSPAAATYFDVNHNMLGTLDIAS
ncbi:MAG TPA: hypothetical protein VJB59_11330 [Bdellovibrionota bacterium]|nr:hypothetical protein [Bdellovibrionota bacterium]